MNAAYNTGAIKRGRFPQNTQIDKIKKPRIMGLKPGCQLSVFHQRQFKSGQATNLRAFAGYTNKAITLFHPSGSWVRLTSPNYIYAFRLQHVTYKQFLNYQGVVIEKSGVKSVVKPSEISLFSSVFTGGLGHCVESLSLRLNYISPVFTGLFSFINLKP